MMRLLSYGPLWTLVLVLVATIVILRAVRAERDLEDDYPDDDEQEEQVLRPYDWSKDGLDDASRFTKAAS